LEATPSNIEYAEINSASTPFAVANTFELSDPLGETSRKSSLHELVNASSKVNTNPILIFILFIVLQFYYPSIKNQG
jgi:hypothetical protein